MRRTLAAYSMELRLICLHWSYWLLHLVWTAFVLATMTTDSRYGSAEVALPMLSLFILPFISLAVMAFTGISASRSARTRFDTLEAAYPTGAEVILGRWAAVVTAMSGFLVVPLGMAVAIGPLDGFLRALPVFLVESLTLFGFIAALIWLLQVTVGIRRWVYPVFGIVWLGSAVVPATLNPKTFPFSLLLAFTAQGWNNQNYSELWGRLPLGSLPLFYNLFYAAALLLVLGVVVWRWHTRRFYRRSLAAVVVTLAALAAALAAGGGYTAAVASVNTQVDRHNDFIMNRLPGVETPDFSLPADMPYTVTAYDVSLDLSGTPQFHTAMTIVNRGDAPLTQLDFSLNEQLAITNASVDFTRSVDFVHLTLAEALPPGETITIELDYEGALWYYDGGMVLGQPQEAASFIHPDGINLTCPTAWYPIPGRIIVGRLIFFDGEVERSLPDCIIDAPTAFALRVENPGSLRLASNLPGVGENEFAAGATTWVHLLGAPELVIEDVDDITLVTVAPMLDDVRPIVAAHYPPALVHLRRFFPDVDNLTVFAVDAGFTRGFTDIPTPAVDDHLIAAVPRFAYLFAFEENPSNEYLFVGQTMIDSLFGPGDRFSSISYTDDIGYFLWAHYMADGDPAAMRVTLTEGIPQGQTGLQVYSSQSVSERYPIAGILYDVYVERGEAAVADLLRQMLAQAPAFDTMTKDAIVAWVQEAARAD